ncbi:MAG: helix-turn-helix domain-containing protein [Sporolactobacillus sp.]
MKKLDVLISGVDYLLDRALKKILKEDCRFHVLDADSDNGTTADQCSQLLPDIVFMDAVRFGKSTVAEIQNIRQRFPSIRIYIVTNISAFDLIQEMLHSGVTDYLLLPLSLSSFKALLNKIYNAVEPYELSERFNTLIIGQDFSKVYQEIPKLVTVIQDRFHEKEEETLRELDRIILENWKMIRHTNLDRQATYREKMNFTREVIEDDYRLQFHLFSFFDEIYRQRLIQKTPQMSQVFHYVDERIYQAISLADTAEACTISQGYLSRVMKHHYGFGFNNYIQIRKIQLAKRAFYFNQDKVIDVAFQLSYNEPSYFSKVFKRLENIAPTDFKKQMIENR